MCVPWWTSHIKRLRQLQRKAEKKWRSTRSETASKLFLKQKSLLRGAILKGKSAHLEKTFWRHRHAPKRLWRELNSATGRIPPCSLPSSTSSDNALAEEFNCHFQDKVAAVHSSIVAPQQLPSSSQVSVSTCTPPVSHFSLSNFDIVTEREMSNLIRNSPCKSDQCDPLPTWLLKRHLNVFLPLLTALVNLSLTYGMPHIYKHAIIRPLLKKKNLDKEVLANYRPISGLPFISKAIERAVSLRLLIHLQQVRGMDMYQSAYRPGFSCESAITRVLDSALSAADKRQITVLILLDLSAAFDTVEHALLIDKLSSLGVSGSVLQWFQCYLSSRTQSVIVRSSQSLSLPLTTGVPQGSVLGPLLFSVYLHGIGDVFSRLGVEYVLYADDIQFWIHTDPEHLPAALQQVDACVTAVRTWLAARMLLLNESKTEVIILSSKAMVSRCPDSPVQIGASRVTPSSKVRDLGVILDATLSMEDHITSVSRSAFAHLTVIARLHRTLPTKIRCMLIHSLVLSRILFCASIFHGITKVQLRRLQRILNAASRLAASPDFRLLRADELIQYRTIVFIRSILASGQPEYLAQHLLWYQPTRELRSSDQRLLRVISSRTQMAQRAFRVYAPKLWNDLDSDVRQKILADACASSDVLFNYFHL